MWDENKTTIVSNSLFTLIGLFPRTDIDAENIKQTNYKRRNKQMTKIAWFVEK